MWEEKLIEGVLHRRSHSIPLRFCNQKIAPAHVIEPSSFTQKTSKKYHYMYVHGMLRIKVNMISQICTCIFWMQNILDLNFSRGRPNDEKQTLNFSWYQNIYLTSLSKRQIHIYKTTFKYRTGNTRKWFCIQIIYYT